MLDRWLEKSTQNLPMRLISIDGNPYLERYSLGKYFGVTFYLHRFLLNDSERWIHNHPWPNSVSFILTGCYVEERLLSECPKKGLVTKHRTLAAPAINRILALDFHRIIEVKPDTWTLFCHGKRTQSWGFKECLPALSGFGNYVIKFSQPLPDVAKLENWTDHAKNRRQVYAELETPKGDQ